MKCETLDSELKINCPDGFHKMSKDELAAENCYGDPPKLCLTNPERHIKISCSFKKYNPVAAALADQKGTAKAMQSKIARLMNGYNYSLKRFLTAGIGDFTADGFEYSYEAQGICLRGHLLLRTNALIITSTVITAQNLKRKACL